jgi:hypothetical protein
LIAAATGEDRLGAGIRPVQPAKENRPMSVVPRRALARVTVSGAAAALLVGGLATGAQAATYPHLTLAKAKTALPTSKSLPGGVKLVGKVRTAGRTYGDLCPTVEKHIPLPGGSVVIADYSNGLSITSPNYLAYEVSVVVFASSSQAKSGVAALTKAEKACPKTADRTVKGVPEHISRTLLTKATSKAWTGYRTIDHISATSGATTVAVRGYETYLVRGNALVVIDQVGAETATNGKLQDTRRKAVTNLVIKRVSALK